MAEIIAAFRVRISGRVQGVAYRAWARDEAKGLGLQGWVRNEPDGSVLAFIAGPPEKVSKMIETFWQGPLLANVTGVEAVPAEHDDRQRGFRIAY